MFGSLLALVAALAWPLLLFTQHTDAAVARKPNVKPIIGGVNFPDPAVIRHHNWHLFSTNAIASTDGRTVHGARDLGRKPGKLIHVPVASTPDFQRFTYHFGKDALPRLPGWVDKPNPRVWAPDVVRANNGKFVLYYSAAHHERKRLHCLGVAVSDDVQGPYVDRHGGPWICPLNQGGAIDASGFYDERTNTRWVVYKIDGNAIGNGGACGNTVEPVVPTPIMLQQVNAYDGITKIGGPIEILRNGPADGPYVEAPTLNRMGGKFVLFFSSQCFLKPEYDVQYAVADRIKGPYWRRGELLKTGTRGLEAPGGFDVAVDGDKSVWHGDFGGEGRRAAFAGSVSLKKDGKVAIKYV